MRAQRWWLVVVLATLAAMPALARSRDDVMAGAYRCGAIADDRQWLDCFYGAAQPVRAELNLAPPPDSQLRLAAAPPTGGNIRNASVRDEAMANAARCYGVADGRQWLSCYYAAVQPVRSLLNLAHGQKLTVAPVEAAESDAFAVRTPAHGPALGEGFSEWLGGSSNRRIVTRLESYSFDDYGIFKVKLANGQVWQQRSGDTSYAHWKKPAASYTALITRGALGSINFAIQGEPHIFKVIRVK